MTKKNRKVLSEVERLQHSLTQAEDTAHAQAILYTKLLTENNGDVTWEDTGLIEDDPDMRVRRQNDAYRQYVSAVNQLPILEKQIRAARIREQQQKIVAYGDGRNRIPDVIAGVSPNFRPARTDGNQQ